MKWSQLRPSGAERRHPWKWTFAEWRDERQCTRLSRRKRDQNRSNRGKIVAPRTAQPM